MDPSFMPSRKSFERAGTELIFLINIKEIERERYIYYLFIRHKKILRKQTRLCIISHFQSSKIIENEIEFIEPSSGLVQVVMTLHGHWRNGEDCMKYPVFYHSR